MTDVARYVHVRQKMHFDLDQAPPLTRFAAPALDVERETSRAVAARTGFGHAGEQLADWRKQAGIGGRIGTRGATDRRLVDIDDLVEMLQSLNLFVGGRFAV